MGLWVTTGPAVPDTGVPGEQVQHLLLAAGDGGEGLHDGAGGLPSRLGGRGEQHLGEQSGGSLRRPERARLQ